MGKGRSSREPIIASDSGEAEKERTPMKLAAIIAALALSATAAHAEPLPQRRAMKCDACVAFATTLTDKR